MPRGQPFTALCITASRLVRPVVADLHSHTTASDGDYTTSQIVAFATQAKLHAIAITDHDTLAGVPETPGKNGLTIVPGVEVSSEFQGREIHILGLFVRLDCEPLNAELSQVCEQRRIRFRGFCQAIPELDPGLAAMLESNTPSLGRRHVANLLERSGLAHSRSDAWRRFVSPLSEQVPQKRLVPAAEAIRLIHEAGGLASLAHPPEQFTTDEFQLLQEMGLDALETKFPAARASRTEDLGRICKALRLGQTGGSDCHGGGDPLRSVGSRGLSHDQWDQFIELSRGLPSCLVS